MEPVIYAGCTNNVQAQSTGRSGVQNCWRSCNAASSSEQMNKRLGVAQTPELLDDDALASPASLSPACSERSPHCLSREAQTPIVHQERKGAIPKSERLVICTQVSGIWWAWPASDRPTIGSSARPTTHPIRCPPSLLQLPSFLRAPTSPSTYTLFSAPPPLPFPLCTLTSPFPCALPPGPHCSRTTCPPPRRPRCSLPRPPPPTPARPPPPLP